MLIIDEQTCIHLIAKNGSGKTHHLGTVIQCTWQDVRQIAMKIYPAEAYVKGVGSLRDILCKSFVADNGELTVVKVLIMIP